MLDRSVGRRAVPLAFVAVLLLGGTTEWTGSTRWQECRSYDALLDVASPVRLHAFAPAHRILERITCAVTGTVTPTVTFSAGYRATANGATTELESGTVCDEDGTDQTSGFNLNMIPALSYLTMDITAVGGTTRDQLMVCLSGR